MSFHLLKSCVENISGRRAAIMGQWGMNGNLLRSIYIRRIRTMQNRYAQASVLSPGFDVTEGDGRYVHPLEYL